MIPNFMNFILTHKKNFKDLHIVFYLVNKAQKYNLV